MHPLIRDQIDSLTTLEGEAGDNRDLLYQEAIVRVRAALQAGIRPLTDDVRLVQQFVGKRTTQNRWGK